MRTRVIFFIIGLGAMTALGQPLAGELTSPDLWKPDNAPFSFRYNGKASSDFLKSWKANASVEAGQDSSAHSYSFTDPTTHLVVTAQVRLYPEFPGVADWVLRFRNDGPSDTPILEDILPLHWNIAASPGDCFIRHAKGSNSSDDDFMPLTERLGSGDNDHLESEGGRSSSGMTLPFFNLQTGDHGLIAAIGWSGNWKADFKYAEDGKTIRLSGGMKETHLLLHPGEEIRTPRIVLMSWAGGDWQQSQNAWRRLLFAHYTPKENGKPILGPVLFGSWGSEPIADKLAYIQWVHDHKIPVDVYAVDAGWYGDSLARRRTHQSMVEESWRLVPKPTYYPTGIKPLGDALKATDRLLSLD